MIEKKKQRKEYWKLGRLITIRKGLWMEKKTTKI